MILKTVCCTFLSVPFSIMHAQKLGEGSDPLRGMGLGWACKTGLGLQDWVGGRNNFLFK